MSRLLIECKWHESLLTSKTDLLSQVKEEGKRHELISEGVCSMCCNEFHSESLKVVSYNGLKYHSYCINFQLNKVVV